MAIGTIKTLCTVFVLTWSLAAAESPALAQKMAPGPALPGNIGGVGPGGSEIAPGPATGGDSSIEQEGPGGVPLARGPAITTQPNRHHHHTFHSVTRSHRYLHRSGL
jgi:hypothetical protein